MNTQKHTQTPLSAPSTERLNEVHNSIADLVLETTKLAQRLVQRANESVTRSIMKPNLTPQEQNAASPPIAQELFHQIESLCEKLIKLAKSLTDMKNAEIKAYNIQCKPTFNPPQQM